MRSRLLRLGGAVVLVASFAFATAPAANATVHQVYVTTTGTGGVCSSAHPCSITTAVTTATPGTHIHVAGGTYDAQLTVTTPNLTIVGKDTVVIQPTSVSGNATKADGSTPVAAIIGVSASGTGLTIADLTVDGSQADLGSGPVNFAGIEYHDADGTVKNVHVVHTQPSAGITGAQVGDGISVASTSGTATVSMSHDTIATYNKNGIACRQAGTTCSITSTTVTGTPTDAIAQNGIEFVSGAGGSIGTSTVAHDTYTGNACDSCASGILLFQAADGVSITHSVAKSSDTNIVALGGGGVGLNTENLVVSATNATNASAFDGLALDSVDNATVTGGSFIGNGEYGIAAYGATNSSISGATANKNATAGIYLDGSGSSSDTASGNTVSTNHAMVNGGPGIWAASGATTNTFSNNVMRHNSPDAQDDNLPAGVNSWTGNDCVTSSPATGLCS